MSLTQEPFCLQNKGVTTSMSQVRVHTLCKPLHLYRAKHYYTKSCTAAAPQAAKAAAADPGTVKGGSSKPRNYNPAAPLHYSRKQPEGKRSGEESSQNITALPDK